MSAFGGKADIYLLCPVFRLAAGGGGALVKGGVLYIVLPNLMTFCDFGGE